MKYKSTKKIDPKRVTKAIAKDTGSKKSGDFGKSVKKCSPEPIKKFTSNGAVAKVGKAFKKFLGIKK